MKKTVAVIGTLALIAGCGSSGGSSNKASTTDQSHTAVRLATQVPGHPRNVQYVAHVDNPWFPLKPGTTWIYRGLKDGKPSRDVVTVPNETRVIDGVRTQVVKDDLYLKGKLEERTTDWYAQDTAGNVWYFGEQTAELDEHGKVTSTSGTWTAGSKGAVAGIYFPAHPRVGQSGRQEYYKGQAEDHFRVKSLDTRVKTPGASSNEAVVTEEWTPLEPKVLDNKYYVRGVGTVLENAVKGPAERNTLIEVQHR